MKKLSLRTKSISLVLLVTLISTFLFSSVSFSISYAETSDLEVGETYFGFKLVEERNLEELNSIGRVFYHEKSGARLFQIENDDQNKSFSISFRTPVDNNKGIPHILEHVLLTAGSEKYPVKQLFFEILKGSLTKNINGFTSPDKTTYIFSSMNDKEFDDLMDIYLSLVFNPAFYKDEKSFKVDGWHYKIEDKDGPLEYNGVVYNEMKGSLSSPDTLLYYSILKSLYPDTNYAYEFGGNPSEIPDLTFEELKNFYDKYYHPSNSYIYLYGDMDILEKLDFIDENYLSKFDGIDVDSKLISQEAFKKRRDVTVEYPIGMEESEEGKSSVSLNFAVDGENRIDTWTSFNVLTYMLFNNPASPVVQKLNSEGFYNISGGFSPTFLQPFLSITARNINPDMKEKFVDIVLSSLEDIVENGIDKNLIKSTLNSVELELRQQYARDINTGIMYGELVMLNWLYDKDPFAGLSIGESFSKLNIAIDEPYFEELIKEYILDNDHSSLVLLKPRKGLMEERLAAEAEKLEEIKKSLTDEELEKLIKDYIEFTVWNNSPNSEEALSTIPTLSLEDLRPNIEEIPTIVRNYYGIKVLHHPLFTNGVGKINLYFDASTVRQEQIPYINLLAMVLGNLSTKNYHYTELPIEKAMYTGGIYYNTRVFNKPGSNDEYYPKLVVSSMATEDNISNMLKLIGEEIKNTKFDDKERLRQLISVIKGNLEAELIGGPINMGAIRNISYFSPSEKYLDTLTGFSYYDFIADLDKNFDDKYENIVKNLDYVKKAIFNRKNLVISITGENETYKAFEKNFFSLTNSIGSMVLPSQKYKFDFDVKNEAFAAPMDILYNFAAFDLTELGYEYTGKMEVLNNLLQLDYLFNELRIKGGAYGAISAILNENSFILISYMDPNLRETYDVYKGLVDYLKNFNLSEEDFEKYIISSLAQYYMPVSNMAKGDLGDSYYFYGTKMDDLNRVLDEILNTRPEDIRDFAKIFQKGLKDKYILSIGNEKIILDNGDVFNKINNLIK
ncbi:MAG: insulinase family protein [Tissierellia bacterium]|nr:insulinase family protein [Tissierellia bacterium]